MFRNTIKYLLFFLCIPAVILLGTAVFKDKQYAFISIVIIIIALIPLFITFEKKNTGTRRLIIIAVMTAISVFGRFVFAVIPGFKPVAAIVIITALFFGGEAGFITGALSALISNIYFGQGPWTPFQMFAWGVTGLIAGMLSKPLKENKFFLSLYGILAGISYSLLMDIWTTFWYDNNFNTDYYLTAVAASLPYIALYAASNAVFLLLLVKPIGEKLNRIKIKYGL